MKRWWPFAALCTLAATSWMPVEHWPHVQFTLLGNAVACAVGALLCWGLEKNHTDKGWRGPAGGALVILGPALPALAGVPTSGGLSITLALTAVVIAVAAPAMRGNEFAPASLWPGLAAAAGLLIAMPMPGLNDWRSDVLLVAAPVATGIGAVMFRDGPCSYERLSRALVLAAVGFGAAAIMQHLTRGGPLTLSLSAVALDGALFVLSLLALKHISPMQYAARYVIVPLALLVEGVTMASSALLNVRTVACAALLAAAAVAMLRGRHEENAA